MLNGQTVAELDKAFIHSRNYTYLVALYVSCSFDNRTESDGNLRLANFQMKIHIPRFM